jgi:hypothetical protein
LCESTKNKNYFVLWWEYLWFIVRVTICSVLFNKRITMCTPMGIYDVECWFLCRTSEFFISSLIIPFSLSLPQPGSLYLLWQTVNLTLPYWWWWTADFIYLLYTVSLKGKSLDLSDRWYRRNLSGNTINYLLRLFPYVFLLQLLHIVWFFARITIRAIPYVLVFFTVLQDYDR